jgi:hypothetical protein
MQCPQCGLHAVLACGLYAIPSRGLYAMGCVSPELTSSPFAIRYAILYNIVWPLCSGAPTSPALTCM